MPMIECLSLEYSQNFDGRQMANGIDPNWNTFHAMIKKKKKKN